VLGIVLGAEDVDHRCKREPGLDRKRCRHLGRLVVAVELSRGRADVRRPAPAAARARAAMHGVRPPRCVQCSAAHARRLCTPRIASIPSITRRTFAGRAISAISFRFRAFGSSFFFPLKEHPFLWVSGFQFPDTNLDSVNFCTIKEHFYTDFRSTLFEVKK
jgi:hypothetical protein